MVERLPIARSPIAHGAPFRVCAGWEVSNRKSSAALRLMDLTACAKLLIRGKLNSALREALPQLGRARRITGGPLIVAAIPDQWLMIAGPDGLSDMRRWFNSIPDSLSVTLTDLTHARVLLRLTGAQSANLLSKVCALNLGAAAFPDGRATRSSLAKVPCEIIRDDQSSTRGIEQSSSPATPSYLIMCDRPVGEYIFDALIDAGSEYKIDIDGFSFG
jgi:heterotetrameric sarcosine oxidase gamma subunit